MIKKIRIPKRIEDVSLKWFSKAPYFFEFLLRFNYYSTEAIDTMGVNSKRGKINLYINQEFMDTLSDDVLEGVLVHEIMHLINMHHDRKGTRLHTIFNIANDACINETILKTTINGKPLQLPEQRVDKEALDKEGYEGEMISEHIYDFLYEKNKDDIEKQQQMIDELMDKLFDDHEALEESDDMAKETIKQITQAAKCRGYGSITGEITDYIKQLEKSKVDWKKQLYNEMKRLSYEKTSFIEQTWTRVNRRNDYLQGKKYLNKQLIIAVDTSGSTSGYLESFFSEIENLVKDMSSVTLIQCDCEISDVNKRYRKGDWKNIEIKGMGGTAVQPVFDYMNNENKLKDHTLIYFTDGEFNFSFETYGIQTIWCVCNDYDKITVPKGKNIYITED